VKLTDAVMALHNLISKTSNKEICSVLDDENSQENSEGITVMVSPESKGISTLRNKIAQNM
jgi:hypothetical protein